MYMSRITQVMFLFEPKPQYFPEPNQVVLVPKLMTKLILVPKLMKNVIIY